MKYNLVVSRTYVTEMIVVADDEASAWDWINDNAEAIYEAELEQMNVINEESSLEPVTPSQNEVEELADLVCHINQKLQEYSTRRGLRTKELYKALERMLSHDNED